MNQQFKLLVGIGLCLAAPAVMVLAGPAGSAGYTVESVYENPHAGEVLTSFDWTAEGDLYYTTGQADWSTGFAVYRHADNAVSNIFTDADVFAGTRITVIGGRVFFKDGGDTDRVESHYFRYDPQAAALPVNLNVANDLWGLATRDGTDLWGAGGAQAAIYYTPLDQSGNLEHNPLVNLGTIGNYSGTLTFDAAGNLYYAQGYNPAGPAVYRWSAAEVAAAIADPDGAPLRPAGRQLATLSSGDGASGMVADADGHPLLTATSFVDPSELQRLLMLDGHCIGYEVLARSLTRIETVRMRDGVIHVAAADGVYAVVPEHSLRIVAQEDEGGAIAIIGLNDGDRVFGLSALADEAQPWVVRGMDGRRVLLQAGDGGAVGIAELNADNTLADFVTVAAAAPGWIARALDGNRILAQAVAGGALGIQHLNAGYTPGGFTLVVDSAEGWIARDLDGDRILAQAGDGGAVVVVQLDAGNRPVNIVDVVDAAPGWSMRALAGNLLLAQNAAEGIGGAMELDDALAPAGWRLFLNAASGWTFSGLDVSPIE